MAANLYKTYTLSMEAQQLLQQDCELFLLPTRSQGFVEEGDCFTELASERPISEYRKRKRQSEIPGCLTLLLDNQAAITSRRSHFSPIRRKEVARIRSLGACLTCRSKKNAVSFSVQCSDYQSTNSEYSVQTKLPASYACV